MTKAKEALKAELLELYNQALDEMLETCPEQADFAVLEEQVEKLAARTLPQTLSTLPLCQNVGCRSSPKVS